jgi:hypothetical protein
VFLQKTDKMKRHLTTYLVFFPATDLVARKVKKITGKIDIFPVKGKRLKGDEREVEAYEITFDTFSILENKLNGIECAFGLFEDNESSEALKPLSFIELNKFLQK